MGGIKVEREKERYLSESVYAERVRRDAAAAASALAAEMKEAAEQDVCASIGSSAAKMEVENARVAAE